MAENPPNALPELLTTRQAAELVVNCGERTLWRWSRSGLAPRPIKIGGTDKRPAAVRFRRDELLDWIAAGCPRVDGKTGRG